MYFRGFFFPCVNYSVVLNYSNIDIEINLGIYHTISTTALLSWWGGVFERMFRSVQRCLKNILLGARIAFEELETVLNK